MRICYVSHSCLHFTAAYVDYFAARGHEVHLVSCSPGDLPNAVNHHPVDGLFDPMTARGVYFRLVPRVRRMIRRIAPDLVHAHYLPSNGMMAAAAGVHPLVVTAHGSDVHESVGHWIKRPVIRYAMRRAELVNPVSRDLERKILSLGVPPERILRLTMGIDTRRFWVEKPRKTTQTVRLICTRHLRPIYQCDMIVRAAALLRERGLPFELIFAGAGPGQAELEAQVERSGLAGQVRFMGGYRPEDLPGLLAEADVYVSASRSDGTSLSLLEALAAGTFPVVSDITANREWLTGRGDGLLFDADSHAQVADALERAISDADLRHQAVAVNRERVLAEGDRDTNMGRLAERYERLVARGAGTRRAASG